MFKASSCRQAEHKSQEEWVSSLGMGMWFGRQVQFPAAALPQSCKVYVSDSHSLCLTRNCRAEKMMAFRSRRVPPDAKGQAADSLCRSTHLTVLRQKHSATKASRLGAQLQRQHCTDPDELSTRGTIFPLSAEQNQQLLDWKTDSQNPI